MQGHITSHHITLDEGSARPSRANSTDPHHRTAARPVTRASTTHPGTEEGGTPLLARAGAPVEHARAGVAPSPDEVLEHACDKGCAIA